MFKYNAQRRWAATCEHSYRELVKKRNPQLLGSMRWTMDMEKSQGSIFVDTAGNEYLDAFMQISSIPLGYNNEELISAISERNVLKSVISRPAIGMFPPANLPDLLEKPLQAAPNGLSYLQGMMCGATAVENAIKNAFGHFGDRLRGGKPPTEEHYSSAMRSEAPGSPSVCALSFNGCFHGRTLGALSMTSSKATIKVDFPAFKWPRADFPQLRYPLHEHQAENEAEEARCLAHAEELFETQAKQGCPIAAVIIEPIQGEGGDRMASDQYFRKLTDIARKNGAAMIADEVQTGFGATGRWWASDYWEHPVDMLTFAKKAQAAGYYYNENFAANPNVRIFNTWNGEPLKLAMMSKCVEIVQRDQLLENVNHVGGVLKTGFEALESEFPELVSASRGRGLHLAFDMADGAKRDFVVSKSFEHGLLIGGSGDKSVRMRPALNFSEAEANKVLDVLRQVLKKL